MTAIKKLIDGNGNQCFPQTHTKAVVDDNGYTAESKLGAMQDEINNLQEGVVVVGEGMTPVPSDLAPTEGSTNWVTSGGVYNAMQVVQSELTELAVNMGEFSRIALTNSNRQYYLGGTLGNQEWRDSTGQYANQCYAVTGGHFYKLVANNTVGTTYAFIKSLPTAVGEVDFADNGKNISYPISAGEVKIFQVPDDCVYVTFLSRNRQPSAFYELVTLPTYKLINDETLIRNTDGRIICTSETVPAGATLFYDFSITGGTATSPSSYLAIHKKDGTMEFIGKTGSASGNTEYANQYILPFDYEYVSVTGAGTGSMTMHKLHSSNLIIEPIEKGVQAYKGMLLNRTLISSPKEVTHGTILFTNDDFKCGDTVHISITGKESQWNFIEFYNFDGERISYWGKSSAKWIGVNFEGNILIPEGFAYASVFAKDTEENLRSVIVNSLYRVPNEWGVYKIGNPLFETLGTYNERHSEEQIANENVFNTTTISNAIKRIPAVIITNSGTVLAACEDRPSVSDGALTGIILARKASGDDSWTYINVLPYSASSYGKLMNPCFVVDRNGAHGATGRIYLFALSFVYSSTNQGMAYKCTTNEIAELYIYSDDDGLTWSSPILLNRNLWDTSLYTWMCNSPANGIVTKDGSIVIPCMGRKDGASGEWIGGFLYKLVGGDWTFSMPTEVGDNESTVFEGLDGSIYLNCRTLSSYIRNLYKLNITDGTFNVVYNGFNPDVKIQLCIVKCTIDDSICYLMSVPDPTKTEDRNRITIWASNDGIRWSRALRITGDVISGGYSMISCYNGKCVMVWENDGWDCRTIGYADLTPSLELLKQSSLICGDNPDDKIHRVACYEKGISM